MKKILAFGTGDTIPEGAIFLATIITKTMTSNMNAGDLLTMMEEVSHYFLVEVE